MSLLLKRMYIGRCPIARPAPIRSLLAGVPVHMAIMAAFDASAGALALGAISLGFKPCILRAQSDSARAARPDSTSARTLTPVKVTGRVDDLIGIASTRLGGARRRARIFACARSRARASCSRPCPGMIVTQHSGDGKANQYFVRGFNLDHGTDFQTRLEGMPLNMPSHAHGQGYTDLNFLIPELVDYIDYRLGVYHAELGDFGSAGGAEFQLVRSARPRRSLTSSGGEHGLARLAVGASRRVGRGRPARRRRAQGVRRSVGRSPSGFASRAASRATRGARRASRFSVLGMAYRNRWNATRPDPAARRRRRARSRASDSSTTPTAGARSATASRARGVASARRSTQSVQLFGIYSDLEPVLELHVLPRRSRARRPVQPARAPRRSSAANVTHAQQVARVRRRAHGHGRAADARGLHRRRRAAIARERRARIGTVRQDDVTRDGHGRVRRGASRAGAVVPHDVRRARRRATRST